MNTQTHNGFARIIEGARGTIVFGNGIDALTGEVAERLGTDYVLFDAITQRNGPTQRHAIPVASIAYFRYAAEDA